MAGRPVPLSARTSITLPATFEVPPVKVFPIKLEGFAGRAFEVSFNLIYLSIIFN